MKHKILFIIPIILLFYSCSNNLKNISVGEKTKEFTITKSDSVTHHLNLEKDKFYSITVMQKGIDVEVFLKNNKGNVLEEQDSPNGDNGPEQIYFYCEKSDDYGLQIMPFDDDENADKGNYDIEIIELSKKTDFKLSHEEYTEDFRIFTEIFEKANSGLYKYHSKQQIDSVFSSNKRKINENTTYREFYNILWNVIDYTGSCHNSLDFPKNIEILLNRKQIYFPVPLKYIEGKLYSNFDHNNIPTGTQILSVNGVEATLFAKSISQFNSTDGFNTTGKYAFIETSMLPTYIYNTFGEQRSFEIEFITNGKSVKSQVKSITYNEFYENYDNRFSKEFQNRNPQDYSFKKIDSINTGVLTVNTFAIGPSESDEFIEYKQFLDSVFINLNKNKVKSIIVDIRNNGGGIDPCDLLLYSYLTKREFKENKTAFTIFQKLPLEEYYIDGDQNELFEELKEEHSIFKNERYYQNDDFNKVWQPNPNSFQGKIYVLISPYVASAGSLFASMCKSDSQIQLFGEETLGGYYGHTGHIPVTYELPNSKLLLTFSIVNLEQDVEKLNDENYGDGIKPDFKIIQTYSDFMNNIDTQLHFTIEKIKIENNKYK